MNNHFTYERTWEEIEGLLNEAELEQNKRWIAFQKCAKDDRMEHWNNYKGLEGVINTLAWVLGNKDMDKNEVLGRRKNVRSRRNKRKM